MTNKELQKLLRQYPSDAQVYFVRDDKKMIREDELPDGHKVILM